MLKVVCAWIGFEPLYSVDLETLAKIGLYTWGLVWAMGDGILWWLEQNKILVM